MKIWGDKTNSMFDLWSIKHFLMGIALAATAALVIKFWCKNEKLAQSTQKKLSFVIVLSCALAWEVLEFYLETGLLGKTVANWFAGVEHWSNRLIADNALVMLGWWIYQKNKKMVWFAKIYSPIWLFIHIFIFPHSMYLHEVLGLYTLLGIPIFVGVFIAVYFVLKRFQIKEAK